MTPEWPLISAAELIDTGALQVEDGNHGEYRPRPDEFTMDGVAFIRAANLRDGQIIFEDAGKISPVALARIRKGIGKPCDVLLSHKGTVGKVALAPNSSPDYVCSPQTTFWRVLDRSVLNYRFLKFSLESPQFQAQLHLRKDSSDMAPYVSLTEQRTLRLAIPAISVQHAIAEVLGALDDKIAANNLANSHCETLRTALLCGSVASSSVTEHHLADVTTLLARGVAPAYTGDADGVCVLNQRCVRNHAIETSLGRLTIPAKTSSVKMLRQNDVLVNSTGVGTLGRTARWTKTAKATVDSHVTIVRFNPNIVDPAVAGVVLLTLEPVIEAMGEGSTGQTELSRFKLGSLRLQLPDRAAQESLGPIITDLDEVENSHREETLRLTELRDALLPQLMSGRLRVKDAEKQVGAVV